MKLKKLTALVLSACMVVGTTACSSSSKTEVKETAAAETVMEAATAEKTEDTAEKTTEAASTEVADIQEETVRNSNVTINPDGTRTLIDQVGNEVTLPAEIERVAIASVWPLASVYILTLGSDKLVGLDPAIVSAAENSILIKIAPEISEIETGFSQGGYMNTEELIKLDPDVVLYSSGVMDDYDVATQAGIPAVGFSLSVRDFNAVETINTWIELLEDVMGEDLSSAEYVAYGNEIQELVADRLKDVKEEDKPISMFIHKYSDNTVSVPGTGTWADYWITASGGINVASELSGTKETDIEQVYQWDPEKIFITNFNEALPEDLYNNTLCSADWSQVAAVKNEDVNKLPLGMYRWYVTCSDSPMMLLWMAKQNHPALFEDIDFNQTMKDFYQEFYEYELSDEDLAEIFESEREAAGGIKKN